MPKIDIDVTEVVEVLSANGLSWQDVEEVIAMIVRRLRNHVSCEQLAELERYVAGMHRRLH